MAGLWGSDSLRGAALAPWHSHHAAYGKLDLNCVCRRGHTLDFGASRGIGQAQPPVNLKELLFSERTFGGGLTETGQWSLGRRIGLAQPVKKLVLPHPAVTPRQGGIGLGWKICTPTAASSSMGVSDTWSGQRASGGPTEWGPIALKGLSANWGWFFLIFFILSCLKGQWGDSSKAGIAEALKGEKLPALPPSYKL